jgi:hypothetical protein
MIDNISKIHMQISYTFQVISNLLKLLNSRSFKNCLPIKVRFLHKDSRTVEFAFLRLFYHLLRNLQDSGFNPRSVDVVLQKGPPIEN